MDISLHNRINNIITMTGVGLFLIAVCFSFKLVGMFNLLEGVVIPADTRSDYYQVLIEPKELFHKCYTVSENSTNLALVYKRNPIQSNELSIIFHDDGTISISGSLSEENARYYYLTSREDYHIPDGYYYLSNGGKAEIPEGISLYYDCRNFTEEGTQYKELASLPDSQAFKIDSSTFDDAGLVLAVRPGFSSGEPLLIQPMITVKKINKEMYEPAAILKEVKDAHCFKICEIPCERILCLNDKEWSQWMADLRIEHETEGIAWTSIFLGRNYGLQIIDPSSGKAIFGVIDPWGRIMDKSTEISNITELRNLNKGMDLQD